MNKYIILILLVLLVIPVSARQEFLLEVGKDITYMGYTIYLEAVGSQGSAELLINGKPKILSLNQETKVDNLKVTLKESIFITAIPEDRVIKLDLEFEGNCLEDKECVSEGCYQGFCENQNCRKLLLSGCPYEGECKPQGSVITTGPLDSYCSTINKWGRRKDYKELCTYDYECASNICDVICKDNSKMAPAWLLALIGFVIILKALPFIFYPKKSKQISQNYFRNFSEGYFRIFSGILVLIGIVLIILALT